MTILSSTGTAAFYSGTAEQLASLQQQISSVNTAISTGQNYAIASQNPEVAAQMRTLQLQDSQAAADTASANKATASLQLADSAMSAMVNDINQARTLTTQAANGTLTDSQRKAIGTELAQIRQDLLGLANSRDPNGNALFGGGVSGDAYTQGTAGTVTYAGNATSHVVPIGGGQNVAISMTGPEVLSITDAAGNATNVIDALGALSSAISAGGSGAQSAASAGLATLSNALDAVTTAQTVIGSREAWVSLNTQNQAAASTARATEESQIGDTDVSSAAIKLQQLTTALQASQSTFVRLSQLSLFNVIGN